MTTTRIISALAVVAVVTAAAAVGCNGSPGRFGVGDAPAPVVIITTDRPVCQPGQDINVTVRIKAPAGKTLDVYLPIRGQLHARKQGSMVEMAPVGPDDRQTWVDLFPDEKGKPDRAFTMPVSRVFPVTQEPGWYEIWWDGTCAHCGMRSEMAEVRVLAGPPAAPRAKPAPAQR